MKEIRPMLAPLCLLEELKKQQTIWLKDDPAKKEDYVRKMFLSFALNIRK